MNRDVIQGHPREIMQFTWRVYLTHIADASYWRHRTTTIIYSAW